MALDLQEKRIEAVDAITEGFWSGVKAFENFTLGDVGIIAVTVGIIWGADTLYRSWKKKRGYRMVLRERDKKIHDLLTKIINDGLFEEVCKGELSDQECNKLYQELSVKLGLPDLVPKKRRAQIVKSEIKKRRHNGLYETKPAIPDGGVRPWQGPIRFVETIGKASKFWKAA